MKNRIDKAKSIAQQSLTIGKVAKLSGVGIEAIRFYEREKVIPTPRRKLSGYREYHGDIVKKLQFIKRAQTLGFTLKEIRELLLLEVNSRQTCSEVKAKAEAKLNEIQLKIEDLQRMKNVLKEVTEACVASKPIAECPILDAFNYSAEIDLLINRKKNNRL